ncbi:hypothetical protein ACRXCV_06500 [Halobacteriovorax sp. GFR7]|uniref:hypothetical protein n=1 Tax=unclassified Halobacteriovorax TaxID=2639665 RepID=UPI003D963603
MKILIKTILCIFWISLVFGTNSGTGKNKGLEPEFFDSYKKDTRSFFWNINMNVPVLISYAFIPDSFPEIKKELFTDAHRRESSLNLSGYFYRYKTGDCIRVEQEGIALKSYNVVACPAKVMKELFYVKGYDSLKELVNEFRKCALSEKNKECIHYFINPDFKYETQISSVIHPRLYLKEYILTKKRLKNIVDRLGQLNLKTKDDVEYLRFTIDGEYNSMGFRKSDIFNGKWGISGIYIRPEEIAD